MDFAQNPRVTRGAYRRTQLCVPAMPIPMPVVTSNDGISGWDAAPIAERVIGRTTKEGIRIRSPAEGRPEER